MTRRYYAPHLLSQNPVVELPTEEAVHAVRVMRVGVDDSIELFDGEGNQATARVTHVGRRECVCHCEPPRYVDRDPSTELELAIAIPRPEPAKEMVERLTELGVARIQPLVFERTQRPPSDSLIGKLQRIVIEACKQSGRNHLMSLAPLRPFATWIAEMQDQAEQQEGGATASASPAPGRRLVAMPGGRSMRELVAAEEAADGPTALQCTIGPEGGLTPAELAACAHAGMQSIDLGKRILRIETAACVIAARFLWD